MPEQAPKLDLRALAQRNFRTPNSCVGALDIIERYASDPPAVIGTLLEAVRPEQPDGRICELGFGTGWLLEAMNSAFPDARLYGLDMSPGMTAHARETLGPGVGLVRGDMEQLPVGEHRFDVAVTCWTLYFMRDIDGALSEIKRMLRPGGRLVVAANAPDHMLELDELSLTARRAVLDDEEPDIGPRFDLESGLPYMRRHFQQVEVNEWEGRMVLPDAAPLVRLWELQYAPDLAGEARERVRAEFVRRADAWAARDGEIRITRHGGAFVGYKES